MQIYRLVKPKYQSSAFDGEGAKKYGGRWNSQGQSMVYASDSIALCALELLVHLGQSEILNSYMLCRASIDDHNLMHLAAQDLPDNWRADPAPLSTAEIGNEWLQSGASPGLLVPSCIIPEQHNILLNPNHKDFQAMLATVVCTPFEFDGRLMK